MVLLVNSIIRADIIVSIPVAKNDSTFLYS